MSRRPQLTALTLLAAVVGAVVLASTAHAPPSAGQVQVASSAGSAGTAAAVAAGATLAPVVSATPSHAEPELRLIKIIEDFRRGEVDRALGQARELVDDQPNFRLAHLVHGDLLASRAGVPLSFESRSGQTVESLLAEARQRWHHYRRHEGIEYLPQALLQLSDSQRHALVVDLSRSRLFLFRNRNGHPELINDYYVSGGKNGAHKQVQGDRRTPVGVYFVIDRLPGEDLPDKYGPVAFPVDYPNQWDERKGRTGNGIWLHGVASNTYSRPPLDSDGCVALSNEELSEIAPLLEAGSTPVIIAEQVDWIGAGELERRRVEIRRAIETWRDDWESGEVSRYLAHYSNQFTGRGMNKKAWAEYKSRVTEAKRFIDVDLEDLSVFEHPHERDIIVVSFRQRYASDSFASEANKRQYWRIEKDGRWRIVSEETV